jgi:hypothetical protein
LGGLSSFTLRSYCADASGERQRISSAERDYEILFEGGDFLACAYAGVMAMPGWEGATSRYAKLGVTPATKAGTHMRSEAGVMPKPQTPPMADLRRAAQVLIDSLAGRARLRYITAVAGQSETYQIKSAQALAWKLAGFTGQPPSFIKAESDALGLDYQGLAEEILESTHLWVDVVGPRIEAARRKGKVAVSGATSPQGVTEAVDLARNTLQAL